MPPQRRQTSPASVIQQQARAQVTTLSEGVLSVATLAGTVGVNNLALRFLRPTGMDLIIAAGEILLGGLIAANFIAVGQATQPAALVSLGLVAGGTAHIAEQTFGPT